MEDLVWEVTREIPSLKPSVTSTLRGCLQLKRAAMVYWSITIHLTCSFETWWWIHNYMTWKSILEWMICSCNDSIMTSFIQSAYHYFNMLQYISCIIDIAWCDHRTYCIVYNYHCQVMLSVRKQTSVIQQISKMFGRIKNLFAHPLHTSAGYQGNSHSIILCTDGIIIAQSGVLTLAKCQCWLTPPCGSIHSWVCSWL